MSITRYNRTGKMRSEYALESTVQPMYIHYTVRYMVQQGTYQNENKGG